MGKDLFIIDNVWELKRKRIICYGASTRGASVYTALVDAGMDVEAFCDGNPKKNGTNYLGKKVIDINELKRQVEVAPEQFCIVISSSALAEIKRTIQNKEITCDVYSSFAVLWGLYFSMQCEKNVPNNAIEYWKKKKVLLLTRDLCEKGFSPTISGLTYLRLFDILFKPNPVIIYQPGKVGSTSIYSRLIENKSANVLHLHDMEMFFEEHKADEQQKADITNAIKKTKLKVITGVRDPIARDLSLIFEMMTDGMYYSTNLNAECNFLKFITNRLLNEIGKGDSDEVDMYHAWPEYVKRNIKYGAMFDWFDLEIREFLGIDVFAYPFDKEKGYAIIKKDNIEIFIYKLEKMQGLEKDLEAFLEIEDFKILRENMGDSKKYSSLYDEVKKEIVLPEEYMDFYYNDNPRMKHFYTEEEILKFQNKWKRNG